MGKYAILGGYTAEAWAKMVENPGNRETAVRKVTDAVGAKLEQFFGDYPDLFEWTVPDGGCVGFPRYKGSEGVEVFAQRLVEETGVLLLPASIYRSELTPVPQDRFRIGYGRSNVGMGIEVLRAWLQGRPVGGGESSKRCERREESLAELDRGH